MSSCGALKTTFVAVSLVFSTAVCVSGCSEEPVAVETANLHPVKGTVTFNNAPLELASLTFIPIEGEATRACYATTDMSGAFQILSPTFEPGCPVGKYRVVVSKFAKADGSPLPPDVPGDIAAAEGVEHMPEQYSNADQTVLEAVVPQGGTTLTFDLSSKPSASRRRS